MQNTRKVIISTRIAVASCKILETFEYDETYTNYHYIKMCNKRKCTLISGHRDEFISVQCMIVLLKYRGEIFIRSISEPLSLSLKKNNIQTARKKHKKTRLTQESIT